MGQEPARLLSPSKPPVPPRAPKPSNAGAQTATTPLTSLSKKPAPSPQPPQPPPPPPPSAPSPPGRGPPPPPPPREAGRPLLRRLEAGPGCHRRRQVPQASLLRAGCTGPLPSGKCTVGSRLGSKAGVRVPTVPVEVAVGAAGAPLLRG